MDYDRTPNSYYFNGIIKQIKDSTYKSNFTREYTEKFMSSFEGFTCEGTDGKMMSKLFTVPLKERLEKEI